MEYEPVTLERGWNSPVTLIGMNWTTMPPTAPGWHWFRTVRGDQTPTLLWVCEFAGNLNAVWPDGRYEPVMTMAGEWHGPVERPERSRSRECYDPARPREDPDLDDEP